MKILTGNQIGAADRAALEKEGIDALELMERAAEQIALWICQNIDQQQRLLFFIGKGNNGGDGLAAARILYNAGFDCHVYTPFSADEMSEECRENMLRLPKGILSHDFPATEDSIIIDALLGSGLKGTVREPVKSIIGAINDSGCKVISIDLPSGMATEWNEHSEETVHADTTLAIQYPKLAMMLPEVGEHCGRIETIDIGLDCTEFQTPYHFTTQSIVDGIKRPRSKFAYKNMYGHALLVCGSQNMIGAAILATSAALRSGCGLVTTHIPHSERLALQISCPSAMLDTDPENIFSTIPHDIERYSAIGIGCGIGQAERTVDALRMLLTAYDKPMVIDADALNIIARNKDLIGKIPPDSILTPHLGELKRLIGEWGSEEEKLRGALQLAFKTQSSVVVKGAHTAVCMSDGRIYFNSTGDSGMAKGGSGDSLTGLLTGLLAMGYTGRQAAVIGVFEHGSAGEKAAEYFGSESMNSSDMIDFLKI